MIISYISAQINHVQLYVDRIEQIYSALKFSDSSITNKMNIIFTDILSNLDKTKQLILNYAVSCLESLLMLMPPVLHNITSIVLGHVFVEQPSLKTDFFNYNNRLSVNFERNEYIHDKLVDVIIQHFRLQNRLLDFIVYVNMDAELDDMVNEHLN